MAVDGSVKDVTVSQSSGNADLDAASVTCVRGWQYKPATRGGVPVEAAWQAAVRWAMHANGPNAPLFGCAKFAPGGMMVPPHPTTVSFGVGDDGVTHHVTVAQSSGIAAWDRAAVNCVAERKIYTAKRPSYYRATMDIDWEKEIAAAKPSPAP